MDRISVPGGVGAVVAIVVLALAVVVMAIGKMDYPTGGLIAALAIARLC